MSKYIDAEKLKAEIERKKAPFEKDIEDNVYPTYLCALMDIEDLIDSLQQEQQEVDLEEEMDRFFEEMPIQEHENIFEDTYQMIARHFSEIGKLNARKED